MTGWKWMIVAVAGILLATVVFSRNAAPPDAVEAATSTDLEDRQQVRRFWELHRGAGAARVEGDFQRSIELYRAALMIDSTHEDALYYLGNAYLETGRLKAAERTFRTLTHAHPETARGFARLGELHLCFADSQLFDPLAAGGFIDRALALNQEETGPMLRKAQIALLTGEFSNAAAWLEAVTATNPSSIEGYFLLGYVHWQDGRARDAAPLFARALELSEGAHPTDPVVGEGDRRGRHLIMPDELLTCPTMLDLLPEYDDFSLELIDSIMARAYEHVNRALATLRLLDPQTGSALRR